MAQNRVRIIGGQWRSRLLRFPEIEGLRPTPDRVRETLFNWLGQDLTGTGCLDLYAGSGALGFEAASRGARHVVLVERDREIARGLQVTAETLEAAAGSLEVVRADALEFLAHDRRIYDVIFVDPPYALWEQSKGIAVTLLSKLASHLKPDARVYLESPAVPDLPPGWESVRQGRAGAVHYQLLSYQSPRTPVE